MTNLNQKNLKAFLAMEAEEKANPTPVVENELNAAHDQSMLEYNAQQLDDDDMLDQQMDSFFGSED